MLTKRSDDALHFYSTDVSASFKRVRQPGPGVSIRISRFPPIGSEHESRDRFSRGKDLDDERMKTLRGHESNKEIGGKTVNWNEIEDDTTPRR